MLIQNATRTGAGVYNAGYVQRREWMLHAIRPDHYPFNVTVYFEMDAFDALLVRKVLYLMIERHEILRTTLQVIDGNLRQIVQRPENFAIALSYFNISSLPEAERNRFHKDKVAADLGTGFNFETGPLFRVLVFELTSSRFSVHFVFHHVIADLQSAWIFRNDIIQLYKMVSGDQSHAIPGNCVQYREYAQLENELLETGRGDKYRNYWSSIVPRGLPALSVIDNSSNERYIMRYLEKVSLVQNRLDQLPFYDERLIGTVIRRYRVEDAGEIKFIYDTDLCSKIKWYKENGKNGLLSLFIAGWLMAFAKLCGQTDYAFEIPATRRASRQFNETMGWLTAQGPCFFSIEKDISPPHLLDYIDQQLYLLSQYCIYPCETLGYTRKPPYGGRMPVFLTLSYSDNSIAPESHGIVFQRPHGSGTYQDIAFFITVYNDTIVLDITYNNQLFDHNLVTQVLHEHVLQMEEILQVNSRYLNCVM